MVWDVTALVRAWLAHQVPDYGVALAAAPSPDADPDTAGDLLLARAFAIDDPDTLPYLIADVEIYPVTPTPLPVLPLAGSSAGWSRAGLLLAGAALLLLAWAARRR
jgi:hypothetical protein